VNNVILDKVHRKRRRSKQKTATTSRGQKNRHSHRSRGISRYVGEIGVRCCIGMGSKKKEAKVLQNLHSHPLLALTQRHCSSKNKHQPAPPAKRHLEVYLKTK